MEPQTMATAAQKRKSPDQKTTETTTSSSSSRAVALCTNGCGFFGTAANKGMCSKCYLERRPAGADDTAATYQETKAVQPPLKKIKLTVPAVGSPSDAAAGAVGAAPSSTPTDTTQKEEEEEEEALAKPATTTTAHRCMTCRRKVGLTGFQCRCGGTFCGSHRYADAHGCRFDYKAAAREQIAKQNPIVAAAKIARI